MSEGPFVNMGTGTVSFFSGLFRLLLNALFEFVINCFQCNPEAYRYRYKVDFFILNSDSDGSLLTISARLGLR